MKNIEIQSLKVLVINQLRKFKLDLSQYQLYAMWLIIGFILCWSVQLLNRPVPSEQRAQIAQYSQVYLLPQTQALSATLLTQAEQISTYQYFHFLRSLYYEQQRIQFQQDEKQ